MTALDAFRRDRGLLSGDDLAEWLAMAGLTEDTWARRVAVGDTDGMPGPLTTASARLPASAPRPVPDPPPLVWMTIEDGCGDAALRVVCGLLGTRARVAVAPGASLADLVAAGAAAGLGARALKASRRRLAAIPVPFIAHVDGSHWVVVHAVRGDEVIVSDPARGAGALARGELEGRWSGWCAVFTDAVQRD